MGVTETPSIFLQKKKEQNATPSEPNSEKRNQPFTEASLQQAWAQFAQQQQADFGETEKLILSRNISKGEGHKVMIALLSQLEVSFLEKLELEITQTLRNALENDFITLERVIVEDEGSKGKKLYTDKDIFDHMSQENPHLLTLKDKLGLDFDY